MICYSCGKYIEDDNGFEMQVSGRQLIGYDCTCGWTTYNKYLETTPPEIENFSAIQKVLEEKGLYSPSLVNPNVIVAVVEHDNYYFLLDLISQIQFDINIHLYRGEKKQTVVFVKKGHENNPYREEE